MELEIKAKQILRVFPVSLVLGIMGMLFPFPGMYPAFLILASYVVAFSVLYIFLFVACEDKAKRVIAAAGVLGVIAGLLAWGACVNSVYSNSAIATGILTFLVVSVGGGFIGFMVGVFRVD